MNRSIGLLAALTLGGIVCQVRAEDLKSKTEPIAPWLRLLRGDDAKKAAELRQSIAEFEAADKYAEALKLAAELLALRSRAQGAEHWQAIDQKWEIERLKKVAALSQEDRAGWRNALRDDQPERLKWARRILGEEHPDTARGYNDVALKLFAQGKFAEAAPLFQKALDTRRKALGEENPDTARSYNNVAGNLHAQGKYAEAAPLFQKALDIHLKVFGLVHRDTAVSFDNLAGSLFAQEKFAESAPLYRRALNIRRVVYGERHAATARSYTSAAHSLSAQGEYAQAAPLYQNALDIRRKVLGEAHLDTAASYDNLAANLDAQWQFAKAVPLYQKALDIYQKTKTEAKRASLDARQQLLQLQNVWKLADLTKSIDELEAADKYAAALKPAEELLALRSRVQGAGHWQAVDQKWHIELLKKLTALPKEERAGWRRAFGGALEAEQLEAKDKFAEALPRRQERLKWCRKVLGEEHPDSAISYNNVARNLNGLGKYAEAAPLLHKALDIRRKVLGEEHPDTAQSYDNVAVNLNFQGKYAEAAPLFRKALEIRLNALGEEDPDTAASYYNFGGNLTVQGKNADAALLLQKALDIRRKVLGEEHSDTANSWNSVATNLNLQGKFAEAAPFFQKALDINRHVLGKAHHDTATIYNNTAMNLAAQGRNAEAGPLFQKALDINREVLGDKHRDTAGCFNNVANNLDSQGKYAEAAPLYQKALDIYRLGEEQRLIATAYNNVASNLMAQGNYADSAPLFRKALEIRLKNLGEEHPDTASSFSNVASNLAAQGKFAEASPLYQKALDIYLKVLGEEHPGAVLSFTNVAINLIDQGKNAEAVISLQRAVLSYEASRLGVAPRGLERADFGANHSPYRLLAATSIRLRHDAAAWAALENDLARGLLDDLGAARGSRLTADEEKRRQQLVRRLNGLQQRILDLVTARNSSSSDQEELSNLQIERRMVAAQLAKLAAATAQREVATLAQVRAALPRDAAWLAWVDFSGTYGAAQEHWACVLRGAGEPNWEKLPATGAMGQWTKQDGDLPKQFREALANGAPAAEVEGLRQRLFEQRLAPVEKHLRGAKRLFVVPAGKMAGVPVEALTDQYTISYVPSGTLLARAAMAEKPHGDGVLALGDPIFQTGQQSRHEEPLPPGGLLLTQVVPDGNAAKAGLAPADVLLRYAAVDLTSTDQLPKLIESQAAAKSIEVTVWRQGASNIRTVAPGPLDVVLAKDSAPKIIAERRKNDQMRAALKRGGQLQQLPGTRVEVSSLKQLFGDKALLLTDSDASEQMLEEIRKNGGLSKFRYLHFGTHGAANEVKAFESVLYLAQDKLPKELVSEPGKPFINGELSAREVLEYWKLNAELVTLSACETALGRSGGGDGLLGFAQAFLTAGSRAVCLSLWKVDDAATALLMNRFYKNLLGKRDGLTQALPKAEALAEAKNWLRNLSYDEVAEQTAALTQGVARGKDQPALKIVTPEKPKGEAGAGAKPFAHPRYWAAFILIGDPN